MIKRLRTISIIACLLISAISLSACSGEADRKQADGAPVPVVVGKVRKVQERETVSVISHRLPKVVLESEFRVENREVEAFVVLMSY